ncbi:MAG: M4 family metallopeptidase [Algicola sp.]|nr:M4 family metallopeptidase [Algicola sp.]
MNRLKPLTLSIAVILASASTMALASSDITVKNMTNAGTPSFVTGDMGRATANTTVAALKEVLSTQTVYQSNGNEDFSVSQQWIDKLGKRHTRMEQTINGLTVYGTSMIVHADIVQDSNNGLVGEHTPSNIYAVSGNLAVNAAPEMTVHMMQSKARGAEHAAKLAKGLGEVTVQPELAYIYLPMSGETKLAWKMEVTWDKGADFGRDIVFFDAYSQDLLARHAQVHSAKNYQTFTLDNEEQEEAPGTLLCTNTQSCGESSAQAAHDGASKVYDYYKEKFGRNGIDNNDMTMKSSVHLSNKLNNAFWNGYQMMYGDGDGVTFTDLTGSFDVIGHELTHGVVQYTAALVYQNASGALNEAFADIMGVSSDAYRRNSSQPSWLLGADVYTPNTAGDALRYMHNPTQDGQSKDWYPERYPFTNAPSNQNDRGGVHLNSGIANLAYVLLVDGGIHPRGKSTAQVPQIGLAKSEQIFYRALTTYMTANASFDEARTATAQSAQDLYGATEKTAVETAWCAVGVGACPTTTTPPSNNTLENGIAKTGLAANVGSELTFTIEVPTGSTNIKFNMSGGTGDADMYVKFGSAPTDSSYDCRPYESGNTEACTTTNTGGTYHVRLKPYSNFASVNLTASFTAPAPALEPINVTASNVSVSAGAWKRYTYVVPAGYSSLTIAISGGTGDADLFVTKGRESTTSSYDCRPYKTGNNESCSFPNPTAATYYMDLNGYSTAAGITLNLTATP